MQQFNKTYNLIKEQIYRYQKLNNPGRFKIYNWDGKGCIGSGNTFKEVFNQCKMECSSTIKIIDTETGDVVYEGNPSDENENDVDEQKPDFENMGLLLHFTCDDLKELLKIDKKQIQYYQQLLDDLIYCIEGPWYNGSESKEQMYQTRTAGHATGNIKYLTRLLKLCEQYPDNKQLQHIKQQNQKVYDDFIMYRDNWPKYNDKRYGCRCGHFGGLDLKSKPFGLI